MIAENSELLSHTDSQSSCSRKALNASAAEELEGTPWMSSDHLDVDSPRRSQML